MSSTGDAVPRRLPRLGIVIPGRNEATRIADVMRRIPDRIDGVSEAIVIVVDDGSSDDTTEVVRRHGARVIRHQINLGKGAALTTGCRAALVADCEVIALMDADGQHDPRDLPRLLQPILDEEADLAIAVRNLSGQMPPAMRLGNWGLSTAFAILFGRRVADTQCGLRAFRSSVYTAIKWRAADYSVETEMLIRASRQQLSIAQVPIGVIYHDRYKGTTVGDGFKIFGDTLRLAFIR